MAKVFYLTHLDSRVHAFFESEAATRDYAEHYNKYRESDARLFYNEEVIGRRHKESQVPGWYCEIFTATGQIVGKPRIHSFGPQRRPSHLVAAVTPDKIAVVSFKSSDHAIVAVKEERARYLRKLKDD